MRKHFKIDGSGSKSEEEKSPMTSIMLLLVNNYERWQLTVAPHRTLLPGEEQESLTF